MSRFDEFKEPTQEQPRGMQIGGAFECNFCGEVTTSAILNRQEEKLYWDCPNKHSNVINFKN
jgi:hypothetical protein